MARSHVSFLANTSPYRRSLRITHIARSKAPLMLIGGLNDPRVPIGESLQIYKQLEQRRSHSSRMHLLGK